MKIETIGWIISVVGVLPFFGGGSLNLRRDPVARKNIEHIGYPPYLVTHFGISVIALGILTLIPQTAFLGVILTTTWMGGAVAAHVRVKDKWTVSAGILIIPVLVWIGFGLRHQAEMRNLFGF
jgi:uncharacterized membrane protein